MENTLLKDEIYSNLPEIIKQLTSPFSGRERDIVLLSSITVLSACLPNIYGIYDSNRLTPHLFLMITAPAASGKGVMGKSKKLIEKIHDTIIRNSLVEMERCRKEQKSNKKEKYNCPDLDIKILPGNVSSSKIYKHIQNNIHGLLIFETEADTISNMLKQDWGNFSDVLRKAFHHETISISREIDDKFFEIKNPKLSLVLSGTPGQIAPLISSKENGLFSRFIFYYFNEASYWKDVSPEGERLDINFLFDSVGDSIFELYNKLIIRQVPIQVKLTKGQWKKLNETMGLAVNSLIQIENTDLLPTIKRYGVIMFRFCMVLTLIRIQDLDIIEDEIYCDDDDFNASIEIIKITINHSITVSNLFNNSTNIQQLNMRESILLSQLNKNFTRQEALELGGSNNIRPRTLDFILKKFIRLNLISKISNGNFQKK